MKIERVSEHIWALKTWMLFPVRVWIVAEEDGVTLVDAGVGSMAKGILKFVEQLGAGPIRQIVLTHGHSDHVGSVTSIREHHQVPVYVHPVEIPYMEGDIAYPRRKKAAASLPKQLATPLSVDQDGRIESVGTLKGHHTPGHSPGHIVYYHEKDGVLLAGDLFTSKKGRLNRPMPMFTADMQEAVRSSRIVKELKPHRVEVCHGKPVFSAADHLDEYMRIMNSSISV